jgi:hypothetical protein
MDSAQKNRCVIAPINRGGINPLLRFDYLPSLSCNKKYPLFKLNNNTQNLEVSNIKQPSWQSFLQKK